MMRVATVESLLYDWLMLVLESHVHSQRYFGIYPGTLGEGSAIADGSANDALEFRDLRVSEWSAAHVADFLKDMGLRNAAAAAERAQVYFARSLFLWTARHNHAVGSCSWGTEVRCV